MTKFQEILLVDEIDALKKVTTKRTPEEVGLLVRKAFDNALAGQERVGGDGESTLRSWMHRKYIVFDDRSRNFCKTDEYIQKYRLAS